MQKASKRGDHAIFYHRDSIGRGDQSPPQYVAWAMQEAERLSLHFAGTPDIITGMIKNWVSVDGDIYLDYDVKGNQAVRPALQCLLARIRDDKQVSHLFIHERARLARPQDPSDGMRLENEIRRNGITIHFPDRVLNPLGVRERAEIGESITSYFDYEKAGAFLKELAVKMINAQLNLAEQGFSTGGRPPFFLERWLIDANNVPLRALKDGEIVRMKGCHVVWLPRSDGSLELAMRIIDMLETLSASRAAKILTTEKIPSPDAGKTRTDNGCVHKVSGVWHGNTLVNIARSAHLVAQMTYGRRSMGDHKRFSPEGPRELTEDDLRIDNKPKVIRNPSENWIVAPALYAPLIDPDRIKRLIDILDARGGKQRNKPRSRDESNNPLGGGRIVDMACGWPMYREPVHVKGQKSFRYKCGAYSQSSGALCDHNHIHGPLAADFVLKAIRQLLLTPKIRSLVEKNLKSFAEAERSPSQHTKQIARIEKEIASAQAKLVTVKRNLAYSKSKEEYDAIAPCLTELAQEEKRLLGELETLKIREGHSHATDQSVADALHLFDKASDLIQAADNFVILRDLINLVDVRLFIQFREAKWGKRVVRKPCGGVLTFGNVVPPVEIYQGHTGRNAIKEAMKENQPHQRGEAEMSADEKKNDSLGNGNRGDRI